MNGPVDAGSPGATGGHGAGAPDPGRSIRRPPVIHRLSAAVANQIAAGEVIERPAAVVKELAENSLDAGASRITVRCQDGGRQLVEVEDDGHGMACDDLPLALERHATSKLSSAEDLFRVSTLGFRGEALPSIAAVSRMEIVSRPRGQDQGHRLVIEGGQQISLAPCPCAEGTRVSIRDLFWNVPVRLKFLKNEAAEGGHVGEQVMRLALAHPGVAFRLERDRQLIIDLPGKDTLELRIRALFGRQLSDSLLSVVATAEGMQLSGFAAHPREAKATARRQYLFLNGRHVRDRLLLAAVREGFKGFLEPRLHGAVFLHLDIEPGLVDVNVHPTKSEVRFRRESEVFSLIRRGIHDVIAQNAGSFGLFGGKPDGAARGAGGGGRPEPSIPIAHPGDGIRGRSTVKEPVRPEVPGAAGSTGGSPPLDRQERFIAMGPTVEPAVGHGRPASAGAGQGATGSGDTGPGPLRQTASAGPGGSPVGDDLQGVRRVLQLNRMYLLIETDRGIRLIDQHALHEKALFLTLDPGRTDLVGSGRQDLLIPRPVELGAAEVATLQPLLGALTPFGIQAEVSGPTTIMVRGYPADLRRVDWQRFFVDLLEAPRSGAPTGLERLQERIAHSAACHGAVKAGQVLSAEEQLELVRLLYRLEHMEHCPHGRPTTLDLTWGELERRFQR